MRRSFVLEVLWSTLVMTFATLAYRADEVSSTSLVKLEKKQTDDNRKGSDQFQKIPLETFIKKLEGNIFDVARSVNHLVFEQDATLSHIMLLTDDNKPTAMTKREIESNSSESMNKDESLVNKSLTLPERILLQSTKKLPSKNRASTHLLIDRISLKTFRDGISFIPPFEIKHTKIITASVKDRETESPSPVLSLTKATSVLSTSVLDHSDIGSENNESIMSVLDHSDIGSENNESIILNNTQTRSAEISTPPQMRETLPNEILTGGFRPVDKSPAKSTIVETATITTTTKSLLTVATTTKTSIVQLKESEEELQEKVTEIEAEPVILSARV